MVSFMGNFYNSKKAKKDDSLHYFLSDKVKNFEDLKKIPDVEKVFRRFNTPLSNNAGSLRFGKLIFGDRRHKHQSSKFEATLLMKMNKDILNK